MMVMPQENVKGGMLWDQKHPHNRLCLQTNTIKNKKENSTIEIIIKYIKMISKNTTHTV